MTYRIGEVARLLCVSRESLRNWEKDGLILKPQRSPTGYRMFSESDIQTIKLFLKEKGY